MGRLFNGLPTQGVISHDLSLQATTLPREPLSAVQHESLPFHSLSQRALGTPPPSRIGFLSPCSRSTGSAPSVYRRQCRGALTRHLQPRPPPVMALADAFHG